MISLFGVASIVVFALCVAGLVLHRRVMKRRWRLDAAEELLDELEASADFSPEEYDAATHEYDEALADYTAYTARFPGNMLAKILHLP